MSINYSTFAANPYGALSRPLDFVEDATAGQVSSPRVISPAPKGYCAYCGKKLTALKEVLECPSCGGPTE